MNLYDLILNECQSDAEWGGWNAVAATLNAGTEKVRTYGDVSVAGMARYATTELAAKFIATLQGTIAQLRAGNQVQQVQAYLFDSFLNRFVNAENGLDFTNDELRGYVAQICQGAGWTDGEIQAVLDLGYVTQSKAEKHVGNSVTAEQCQAAYEAGELTRQVTTMLNELLHPAVATGDRDDVAATLRTMADSIEGG